jgi:RNase H-like domain found in reverse transcriptase
MAKLFVLDPDASQFRIGAVLQQYFVDPDGKQCLHRVAYESKKLTPTEQRYSSQEHELLAAKHALNHWHHLLDGSETVIRTDHESRKVYRTKRPMTKRLARFMDEIEHYDPTIVYRPGKLQVVPDALSRMAGRCEGEPADTDHFQGMDDGMTTSSGDPTTVQSTRHNQGDEMETGELPNLTDAVPSHASTFYGKVAVHLREETSDMREMDENFQEECAKYGLGKEGKLYNRETRRHVVWDQERLKEIMKFVHEDLGHYGKEATAKAVRQRFEVASDL